MPQRGSLAHKLVGGFIVLVTAFYLLAFYGWLPLRGDALFGIAIWYEVIVVPLTVVYIVIAIARFKIFNRLDRIIFSLMLIVLVIFAYGTWQYILARQRAICFANRTCPEEMEEFDKKVIENNPWLNR